VRSQFDSRVESRNEAVAWILENVPRGCRILVPKELNLYDDELRGKYQLKQFQSKKDAYRQLLAKNKGAYMLVPVVRQKEGRVWIPKDSALVEFGEKSVDLKYPTFKKRPFFVASGNPKFSIIKL